MDFRDLRAPFPADDIEWRVQEAKCKGNKPWARVLAYVTNRAIMERLDNIVGPAKWKNQFASAPEGGIMCGISIYTNDEWVTKWDGAENTNIEAVKGGLSGSMKRSAVQWGIGRYLYKLDAGWADITANGAHSGKYSDDKSKWFKWNPPKLPSWALPEGTTAPEVVAKPAEVEKEVEKEAKKDFRFLKTMGEHKKRLGDEAYYKVLGAEGFEKSTQISDSAMKNKVNEILKEMGDAR